MKPRHPLQPFVQNKEGTLCFKENKIIYFLLHAGPFSLNQILTMNFSKEDYSQLLQLIGMSHIAWLEVPMIPDEDVQAAGEQLDRYIEEYRSKQ